MCSIKTRSKQRKRKTESRAQHIEHRRNMQYDGEGGAQDQSCTIGFSNNWSMLEQKMVLQEDKIHKWVMSLNIVKRIFKQMEELKLWLLHRQLHTWKNLDKIKYRENNSCRKDKMSINFYTSHLWAPTAKWGLRVRNLVFILQTENQEAAL